MTKRNYRTATMTAAGAALALSACAGMGDEDAGAQAAASQDMQAGAAMGTQAQTQGPEPANEASLVNTDRRADGNPFTAEQIGQFDEPWAMTFLPDGRLLVTEKPGTMKVVDLGGGAMSAADVSGVPQVAYGGQGGLGDIALHPDFAQNNVIYISFAEAGSGGTYGAAVTRGRLECTQPLTCSFEGGEVIWRQDPKMESQMHYGHRLAFGPDGKLYITSGERNEFQPAQDMDKNLGKIVRLNDDGSIPADNPFADQGGVTAQIWSLGHRNPLGIAFDASGQLWEHEMGPRGGDELNLIVKGDNYGYPVVSNGDHYDGEDIPDHETAPRFNAPEESWTPVISPAGFIIYDGDKFPGWRGKGLIGGLSSQAVVVVALEGDASREVERYDMDARIREVAQGPDGYVYVLQDERKGQGGGLLRLRPSGNDGTMGAE